MHILGKSLRRGNDGRTWRAVVRYADGDGRVRQATRSAGAGKREAARVLDELAAEVAAAGRPAGGAGPSAGGRATGACEYAGRMVAALAETGAIEPSTVQDYTSTLNRLRRALGDATLEALTPGRIQALEAALTASGLSASSVGKAHRLLRQACKRAVLDGLIDRDPTDGVKPPKRKNKKPGINAVPGDARRALLDALAAAPMSRVTVAARIALWTGLREGEICGLRWGDVDAAARLIWVRRAVGRGGGGAYLKEAKTGRARDVALPDELGADLGEWRRRQGRPGGADYVMTGTGAFIHPDTVSREWRAVAQLLGLVGTEGRRVTFHDLRHTWATVAVAAGVDIKTVASNLGHANAAMTLNVYASADPDAKRRAAEVVQRAMRG